MYVILISSFFVHFVHRTTYKIQNCPVVIEKNTLYFDSECHTEKLYEFLTITNFKPLCFLSKISLVRVKPVDAELVDVTRYHPILETARAFYSTNALILFK